MKNRIKLGGSVIILMALVFSLMFTACDLEDLIKIPESFKVAGVRLEFLNNENFSTKGIVVIVTYTDSTVDTFSEKKLKAAGISVDSSAYVMGTVSSNIPIHIMYRGEIQDTYEVSIINPSVTTAMPIATPSYAVVKSGADVEVKLECSTAGAEIYYTIDEAEPTKSSTLYNSGDTILINITGTTTLKAKAFSSLPDSATGSAIMEAVYYLAGSL